jgi:hypothetical protein
MHFTRSIILFTSYYHGTISREEAVARLEKERRDGTFLLRMSSTQDKAYTLSVQYVIDYLQVPINLYF